MLIFDILSRRVLTKLVRSLYGIHLYFADDSYLVSNQKMGTESTSEDEHGRK
jgi:hypothetical protein